MAILYSKVYFGGIEVYYHIRRRSILYLAGLMVLLIAIGFTYSYLTRDKAPKQPPESVEADSEDEIRVTEANISENTGITSGEPDFGSVIFLERLYLKCGHALEDIAAINTGGTGLASDMLKITYPGFDIVELTPDRIKLRSEIDSYCPHHYIIGESDGYLAVYRALKENGALYQIETTGIQFESLGLEIQEKVREGLAVDTTEEIELLLENWES